MKKFYPDQPVVGVGAVIMRNGKILLGKRRSEPSKGKWSIPGGLVELGEDAAKAVVREVREESGLDVDEPQLIDVVDNISSDEKGKVKYHFVIVNYSVKVIGGKLEAADDAEELKWATLDEAETYDLTRTLRAFLHRNREKLQKLDSYCT